MKQQIISIIASFMLATPCLHAGIDSWISSILPKSMRASEETRKHVSATNLLSIKRPVIVINKTLDEDELATTQNNLLYSLIYIDEKQNITKEKHERAHTAYHEVGHIAHNHARDLNALKTYTGNAYLTSIGLASYALIYRRRLPVSHKHKLGVFSGLSLLSAAYAYLKIPCRSEEEQRAVCREPELQAEKTAFALIKSTHGNAPLEEKLSSRKELAAFLRHRLSRSRRRISNAWRRNRPY